MGLGVGVGVDLVAIPCTLRTLKSSHDLLEGLAGYGVGLFLFLLGGAIFPPFETK